MQTKNLCIMFTDMKGFTARTSVQSRKQVEYLLDMHDHLIRPIFAQFGGQVIKTIGDAFLVIFESPTDAVLCGMRIQEIVMNHNATSTPEERFEIRIAINAGEVHLKENDIFGEPVNIAARIESIAEPGEVYFTESVYLTMNKNEIPSSEVGHRHLKGIPEQIKVYKVLQEKTILMKSQMKRKDAADKAGQLQKGVVVESMPASRYGGSGHNTGESSSWFQKNKKLLIGIGSGVLAVVFLFLLIYFFQSRNRATPAPQETPVRDVITDQIKRKIEEQKKPIDQPSNPMQEPLEGPDKTEMPEEQRDLIKALDQAISSGDRNALKEELQKIREEMKESCTPMLCLVLARAQQIMGESRQAFHFFEEALKKEVPPYLHESAARLAIPLFNVFEADSPEAIRIRELLTKTDIVHTQEGVFREHLDDPSPNISHNIRLLFDQNNIP